MHAKVLLILVSPHSFPQAHAGQGKAEGTGRSNRQVGIQLAEKQSGKQFRISSSGITKVHVTVQDGIELESADPRRCGGPRFKGPDAGSRLGLHKSREEWETLDVDVDVDNIYLLVGPTVDSYIGQLRAYFNACGKTLP